MRANFFVMYPVASLADVPATYMASFRAPEARASTTPGARLPQHHQRGHEQHHQPGAARAGPGDPRGGVPVRLHAAGGAGGAVCRRHGHARGAGARVRHHARRGRARQPAAPGAARGAGRRRPAGRLPGQHGGRGGGLGAGALRVRVRVDRHAAGAAAGCAGRGAVLALAAGWWGLRDVLRRPVSLGGAGIYTQ
jgi:putative ABC transport system permease protein